MRPAILILDDDALFRRACARILVGKGCRVIEAATIEEARAKCREPVDACLVDQHLPDGLGIEWLRSMRSTGSKMPAVVVSGDASVELACLSADLGAPFRAKPVGEVTLDELIAAARRVMPLDVLLTQELRLTPREEEVIACRVRGVARSGVGAALGITVDAVKSRVRSILRKATRKGYACDDLDDLLVDAERRRRN